MNKYYRLVVAYVVCLIEMQKNQNSLSTTLRTLFFSKYNILKRYSVVMVGFDWCSLKL